jgi:hypothetical protein
LFVSITLLSDLMYNKSVQNCFNEFIESKDTLRIYDSEKLIFNSNKDRLLPLLQFIEQHPKGVPGITVYDKLLGNAAALLSVKAGAIEVFSPVGSQLAVKTFEKYGIKYHFNRVVPLIITPSGQTCQMEKLSMNKDPNSFYEAMTQAI